MEIIGYLKEIEWEIVAKAPVITATVFLIIFFGVRWYYKKFPPSKNSKQSVLPDSRIKLGLSNNLPAPKALSSSQDLIDRWGINWINLSYIISNNCLPAHYDTGFPSDYQSIESIEYEGGYHYDKTQKNVIMSFYFKEADVRRIENILRHIST